MFSRYLWRLFFICLVGVPTLFSQEKLYTLGVSGSYTTSSKLYYFPHDPDEVIRNQSLEIKDVIGIGFDIRRDIGNNVQIGIGGEYLKGKESLTLDDSSGAITVNDGFIAFPVEASGYFLIPFSSEKVKMYIGGGIGFYIGERKYSYGGTDALPTERKMTVGIHVLSGVEFSLGKSLLLRSELKFREVQFESTNEFPPPGYYYSNMPTPPQNAPFASRISIDGILLNLGLVLKF